MATLVAHTAGPGGGSSGRQAEQCSRPVPCASGAVDRGTFQHAGTGDTGRETSQHAGTGDTGQGVLSQHAGMGGELGLGPGGSGNLSEVQEPGKWHQWPRMSRPGTGVCGSQDRGPGRPATVSGHCVPAQHPRGCDRAPCGSGEVLTATLTQGGPEATSASCQATWQPQTHGFGAGDREVGGGSGHRPPGRPSCCPAPKEPDSSVLKEFSG